MNLLYAAKIAILAAALVVVIWAIRGLQAGHVESVFDALGAGRKASGEETYTLCRTRIHALKWADGTKVEEHLEGLKMKWFAYGPEPRLLSYLEIEKWLSKHCQFTVAPLSTEFSAGIRFEPFMVIDFVDKSTKEILKGSDSVGEIFKVGDRSFRSPEFSEALKELRQAAQLSEH